HLRVAIAVQGGTGLDEFQQQLLGLVKLAECRKAQGEVVQGAEAILVERAEKPRLGGERLAVQGLGFARAPLPVDVEGEIVGGDEGLAGLGAENALLTFIELAPELLGRLMAAEVRLDAGEVAEGA